MKKRAKLMIPFAVLSLTAGISAIALTGCSNDAGKEEHTHSYSEWGYDDAQHWKECPDDHEKDAGTIDNHEFFYGECECGAEQNLETLTVSGTVFTNKMGVKSATSEGVTLTAERTDGTDVPGFKPTLNADGTYSVSIKEGEYSLIFSKAGFKQTRINISLTKDDGNLEGLNVTLEFDVFYLAMGWDGDYQDFTHVNDANPYVLMSGKTINVLTNEKYGDVSATLTIKEGNSTHGWHKQGIWIKFDDGKYMMTSYADKAFMWTQEWDQPVVKAVADTYLKPDEDMLTKFREEGLAFTMTRVGRNLYIYVDGELYSAVSLPVEYENVKAQIGFFDYDSAENSKFYFNITDEVDEEFELEVNLPQTSNGTLTPDLTSYRIGDDVIITVEPDDGYTLKSITVNGEDMLAKIEAGVLVIPKCLETVTVAAEFQQQIKVNLDVEIKAKKQGVTGGESLNGRTVSLKNNVTGEKIDITVANDKLVKENIASGVYLIQLESYYNGKLIIADDGSCTIETTLGFILFTDELPNGRIATHDYTFVNDDDAKIGAKNGDLRVMSTTEYNDVTVTLGIKADKAGHSSHTQGIWIKFENGKYMMLRVENNWFQYMKDESSWGAETVMNEWIALHTTLNPMPNSMLQKFENEGLELKLVRQGANLYASVEGKLYNICKLPDEYETMKARVGFFSYETVDAYWDFSISSEADINLKAVVNLPESVEHGTITADKAEYALGETITLTITPDAGYSLTMLFINGENFTNKCVKDGDVLKLYIENNLENDLNVEIMFGEVTLVNLDLGISGKKHGESSVSFNDEYVLLTDTVTRQTYIAKIENDKITIENIPAGTYKVSFDGYLDADLTIPELQSEADALEAVVLEFDLFELALGWDGDDHDFSHVNDAQSYMSMTGKTMNVLTKEKYDDVSVTLTVKQSNSTHGSHVQGVWLKFADGKYVMCRVENQKFQWAEEWSQANALGWIDFLDPMPDYMYEKYKTEGVDLQIVRQGATLKVVIDGILCDERTLPESYATSKAQVGFYAYDSASDARWPFVISKALEATIKIPASLEHGAITADKTACGVGEKVTFTITPENGYLLSSLTVGGVNINIANRVDDGKLEFIANSKEVNVSATFVKVDYADVDVAISGKKLGVSENVALNGKKAVLNGELANYEIEIADGKLTKTHVVAGAYKLTVDGYLPIEVEITANGIAEAIELVYNVFTSAPDSADLSEIGEGKVTATGNGGLSLQTIEKYTDFTAEAKFDVPDYNSRRYSISLKFDDGKNFRVDFAVQDNGNNILQQTNWDGMMFNWEWVDFPEGYFAQGHNSYSEDEIRNVFMKDGLTYKLEREGATVKLTINGVLMKTYTLPDAYKDQQVSLAFIFDSNGTDGTKGFTFDITAPAQDAE